MARLSESDYRKSLDVLYVAGDVEGSVAYPRPVLEALRRLVPCDVVAFHCTATSMEEGMAGEERVLAAVARAGAPRATTTATAIRRACDALGARRIVLVTPYSQKTTDEEAEFLHAAGCEVLAVTEDGTPDTIDLLTAEPSEPSDVVRHS